MPASPSWILDLATAVLQLEINQLLADGLVGIIAKKTSELAGVDLDSKLNEWLSDKATSAQVEKAIETADDMFQANVGDAPLAQWMASLPLRGLPKVQEQVDALPHQPDEQALYHVLRDEISGNWRGLADDQIDRAVETYLRCLRTALLPIGKQALMIIGRSVLRTEAEVRELRALVEQLVNKFQGRPESVAQPERVIPQLPSRADLPAPGMIPLGSRMPFVRNQVFTGREEDLRFLAQVLLYGAGSDAVSISEVAAATGIGGVGKTQLAVEFAYRFGRFFRGVHWVKADEDIFSEIAACGEQLHLSTWPDEAPDQVAVTLEVLARTPPRLLVLDNLADPEILRDWLPRLQPTKVLITSRRASWPSELPVMNLSLGTLGNAEGMELLRRLAPRLRVSSDAELDAITDRLGGLPLALHLAGSYLNDCPDLSPAAYMSELDEAGSTLQHTSMLAWVKGSPTKHESSLAATFWISLRRLNGNTDADMLARRLFYVCGYCAPDAPIPRELLAEAIAAETKPSRAEIGRAILRLYELGLLLPTDAGPSIHILLAEFSRLTGDEPTEASDAQNHLALIARAMAVLSKKALDTFLPSTFDRLRAHMEVLASVAAERSISDAGLLWNNLGQYYSQQGLLSLSRAAMERSLVLDEATYGPESLEVAEGLNNYSRVLLEQGELTMARDAIDRALTIEEATLKSANPTIATSLTTLATILQKAGDLPFSQRTFERVLQIDMAVYGLEHLEVATDMNNLGLLVLDRGDLSGADRYFKQALAIVEAVYGHEHPRTAAILNNIGRVLRERGKFEEARQAFEDALGIFDRLLGAEHLSVATTLNNLGQTLYDLEKLDEARVTLERARDIQRTQLGPNHPDVGIVIGNIGLVLLDQGAIEQAKSAFTETLRIHVGALGPNHPYVGTGLLNLGLAFRAAGQPAEAREMFERALRILRQHRGPSDPTILLLTTFLRQTET